jgi:hypothetical protein
MLANRIMDLFELLYQIELRPKMYFSEVNTLALESFIHGYLAAHDCSAQDKKCNACEFKEFNDWVKCRLHSDKYGVGWRSLLLDHFDEDEALKKCFVYIDEFKSREFNLIAEIVDIKLKERSISLGEEKETIYTTTISLGTYTDDPGYWVKFKEPNSNLSGFYYEIEIFESFIGISREDWTVIGSEQIK